MPYVFLPRAVYPPPRFNDRARLPIYNNRTVRPLPPITAEETSTTTRVTATPTTSTSTQVASIENNESSARSGPDSTINTSNDKLETSTEQCTEN